MINVKNIEKLKAELKSQLELRRRYEGHLAYDQDNWAYIKAEDLPRDVAFAELRDVDVNVCKTNCCLAGTVVVLTKNFSKFDFSLSATGSQYAGTYIDKHGKQRNISHDAAEWLGLTTAQADVLFNSSDGWPEPYRERYQTADAQENQDEKLQTAIDFLDDVVSSNGDVLVVDVDDDEYNHDLEY